MMSFLHFVMVLLSAHGILMVNGDFLRWRNKTIIVQKSPNENSYTSQMVRTIKYFAEL